MRPLVYDFGQLNNDTEKDYTFQIVTDRCQNITEVKSQTRLIQSVADVLAWSQKYMRERNVSTVEPILMDTFYSRHLHLMGSTYCTSYIPY